MSGKIKSFIGSCVVLMFELSIFYGLAFGVIYMVDWSSAMFLAGLSTFFVVCACVVARTAVPHTLLRFFLQPPILIMYAVVVIFSVGRTQPDLTVFAPAFALALIAAALGDRINRLIKKKRGNGR
jgi:hypothetical protein